MASSVLSVRVPDALNEQLDLLSKSTKRSKSYIAGQALEQYVARNAWKAAAIQEAIKEADKGVFISHEAMLAWVDSLGTEAELEPPEPDVFLHRGPR
jgi:predicted transcriptional regulator